MTYSLIDRLADIGTPTAEEAIAQLAAQDALIREMVGALRSAENYIANTEREFDIELSSGTKARAALTRAKEMGYE